MSELFDESGSAVPDETLAVSSIEPSWLGVTTSATVAWAAGSRSPRSHVTVPSRSEQEPVLGVAETKSTPAGRVSVTWTALAGEGPLFVTVSV